MFEVIDSKFICLESIYEESILVLTMKFRNYSANQYELVQFFKLSEGKIHLSVCPPILSFIYSTNIN